MKKSFAKYSVMIVSCSAVVALAALFASSHPDGLEWVAEKLGFVDAATAPAFAPMPDYSFPKIGSPFLSSFLAGMSGVGIILALSWAVKKLISRKK